MTTVALLSIETQIWSLVGNLKKGRVGHSVIRSDNQFLLVGGKPGYLPVEKCTYEGLF